MEKALIRALSQLGCNEKHVRFYQANLELGSASLMEIAKKARLQRSTAYLIATELLTMGLVNENHKTYKKLFVAAEPDTILQKLEAIHRQVGRSSLALKEVMPELRAAHKTTSTRPRVRTFEGRNDLPAIWKDILAEQQEILLWSNQESEEQVFGQTMHDLFIRERIDREIPIRVLSVHNASGEVLQATDSTNMRRTKLLPKDVSFTSETYIYGNKVAVLDIGKEIFGVITENEQIASSQRAIFELMWRQI
jgi:sugar-specific transcriptional regulator TrmB